VGIILTVLYAELETEEQEAQEGEDAAREDLAGP
jgi:hypothetical protein